MAALRRILLLVAFFVLGLVLAGGAVLAARSARALLARRRAAPPPPSEKPLPAGGIEMRLDVAPSGSLVLTFTNVSAGPRPLVVPVLERTGPEIDVVVDEGAARRLEGPLQWEGAGRSILLAPGASLSQDVPLAEYLELQGAATIHVERARLRQEDPRLRSNSVVVHPRP